MNPVVHFELPYENAEPAAAFYGAALKADYRAQFLDTEGNRNSMLQPTRGGRS